MRRHIRILATVVPLALGMHAYALETISAGTSSVVAVKPGTAAKTATSPQGGKPAAGQATATPPAELGQAAKSEPEDIDLGSTGAQKASSSVVRDSAKSPASSKPPAWMPQGVAPKVTTGTERVVFNRRPIKVNLEIGKERMITFPGSIAIHAPEGHESQVGIQTIERTAYITANEALTGLRVIAEDLDTGRMIPVDLVASNGGKVVTDDLEIYLSGSTEGGSQAASVSATGETSADMVVLTRYAARALYAPKRLVAADPSIRPINVKAAPTPGLYRGARIQTTPIAQWRSGNLYVTAVRFTNQESNPVDLNMDDIRGNWLAATPQHARLLASGKESDTTAVYLVCDRPFEACR
jgi:integrating conjugative element protein (TIGR03749 family)